MGLKSNFTDLLWVILFSAFIISFALLFLSPANPNSIAMDSDAYGLNTTATELKTWTDDMSNFANDSQTKLSGATANTNPLYSLFLISVAFFDIPKSFLFKLVDGTKIITNMMISLGLGGTGGLLSIIASITIAVIVIILVLSIIETARTGSPGR